MLKTGTTPCHPFCEPRVPCPILVASGCSDLPISYTPLFRDYCFRQNGVAFTARLRESLSLGEQSLFGQVE